MNESLRWDDVQVFLELYRARTLGGAGRSLGLDLSTMSRRLAGLEARLEVPLFDRTRTGLLPTKAATQLLDAAEEMERAALKMSRAAGGLERAVEGLVRVTAPPGVAEAFLAPAFAVLAERHPGLRFEVVGDTRVADLSRQEADLALRTIKPTTGDLVMTRVAEVKWLAAASPAFAQRVGVVRDWADLPWIGWSAELGHIPPARWLTTHVTREPVLRCNSMPLQVAAVGRGLGVALVPEPYTQVYDLTPVRFSRRLHASAQAWPGDDLWLVAQRAARKVPRIAAVWEVLAKGPQHWAVLPRSG